MAALREKLDVRLKEFESDKYANLIYKMLLDEINVSDIKKYLRLTFGKIDDEKMKAGINNIAKRYFNREEINKKSRRRQLLSGAVMIKRTEIIKYLTTVNKKKSKKVRRHWPLFIKEYPILRALESAYRYFHNCLNESTGTQIDKYIAEYKESKILKLKGFAKGLSADLAAIKEGITSGITSGLVEGGNNKIKLIKRLGYGRMKFPRLKQKILTIANFFTP